MVALEPKYGLPHESTKERPGMTLNGGPDGQTPILARAVADQIERLDGELADVQAQLGRGWVPIDSGVEDGNFTIDLTAGGKFPAGTFSLIRVYLRGSTSVDGVRVNARVNGDSTPQMHLRTWEVRNLVTGARIDHLDPPTAGGAVTSWPVAWWSSGVSCHAEFTIFRTDTSSILSMSGTSYRASAGDTVRHRGVFHGHLAEARLLDSLQIFPFTGSINNCWWWAEGFRL